MQENIEQQLEGDSNLASRLQQLDLPPGAVELDELAPFEPKSSGDSDATIEIQDSNSVDHPSPSRSPRLSIGDDPIPDMDDTAQATFNEVLSASRVYARVEDREVGGISTILTTRSHAWSILLGLSLARISVVAVIKLPLHEAELRQFRFVAFPSTTNSTGTFSRIYPMAGGKDVEWLRHFGLMDKPLNLNISDYGRANLKRIGKELAGMARDPLPYCGAGPIGENMVCLPISFLFSTQLLTTHSTLGKGQSEAW